MAKREHTHTRTVGFCSCRRTTPTSERTFPKIDSKNGELLQPALALATITPVHPFQRQQTIKCQCEYLTIFFFLISSLKHFYFPFSFKYIKEVLYHIKDWLFFIWRARAEKNGVASGHAPLTRTSKAIEHRNESFTA